MKNLSNPFSYIVNENFSRLHYQIKVNNDEGKTLTIFLVRKYIPFRIASKIFFDKFKLKQNENNKSV